MSGIFPNAADGGVVPGNATAAYSPTNTPTGTSALYFSNDCRLNLRSEVLNALISEVECVIDKAGIAYDAAHRCNLHDAIVQLILDNTNASKDQAVTATCGILAPTGPAIDDYWLDESGTEVLRKWSGTAWVVVPFVDAPAVVSCKSCTVPVAYLNCGSAWVRMELPITASGHAVVVSAICNASAPSSPAQNDYWIDTDATSTNVRQYVGATWVAVLATTGPKVVVCKDCSEPSFWINCGTSYKYYVNDPVDAFCSATTPVGAVQGDYWLEEDTSILRRYDGFGWDVISATTGPKIVICRDCTLPRMWAACGSSYKAYYAYDPHCSWKTEGVGTVTGHGTASIATTKNVSTTLEPTSGIVQLVLTVTYSSSSSTVTRTPTIKVSGDTVASGSFMDGDNGTITGTVLLCKGNIYMRGSSGAILIGTYSGTTFPVVFDGDGAVFTAVSAWHHTQDALAP